MQVKDHSKHDATKTLTNHALARCPLLLPLQPWKRSQVDKAFQQGKALLDAYTAMYGDNARPITGEVMYMLAAAGVDFTHEETSREEGYAEIDKIYSQGIRVSTLETVTFAKSLKVPLS